MVLAELLADDKGKGSPIGLFVVLILCVAVYFLYRSMSKQMRKVPDSFDPPVDESPVASTDEDRPDDAPH